MHDAIQISVDVNKCGMAGAGTPFFDLEGMSWREYSGSASVCLY